MDNGKLVLTRKVGESILINGNTEVFVESIKGNRVKLGIRAPRQIPIVRRELITARHLALTEGRVATDGNFNRGGQI